MASGMSDQAVNSEEPGRVPEDRILHIRNNEMEDDHQGDSDTDLDEEESDFRHGTIRVWDEDSDEDDQPPSQPGIIPFYHTRAERFNNIENIQPVAGWWRTLLIGSATPGSLSKAHVAMNLFSSSLHPGVLLAMPVYFFRAGIIPGMIVLVLVSLLGAFGGGLWVSLGRYVGGNTIEAITAKAFGMNTHWKRGIGYGISSLALVTYCTGAAVIAYHGSLWITDQSHDRLAVASIFSLFLAWTNFSRSSLCHSRHWWLTHATSPFIYDAKA